MTLTFKLEDQDHILFHLVEYVGAHVRINPLLPNVCEIP